MSSIETARAIYEEETQGKKSVTQLAFALERRANELEQQDVEDEQNAMREHTRGAIVDTLQPSGSEEAKETVAKLDEAAKDLRSSLGTHNPTMQKLEGNTAGKAQLDSSNMWVDTQAIQSQDGAKLIDTTVAEDIKLHEARHQEQSARADAQSITVKGQQLSETELREFDAMEEQKNLNFLSGEYKAMRAKVAAVLSQKDRNLIKQGRLRELEQSYAQAA